MEPYKLVRQIQVHEKNSDNVVDEIRLDDMDVSKLTSIFGYQAIDPLFYGGYEISSELTKYFPNINFDLSKYDHFVVCYRQLFPNELEVLTINRYVQKEKRKRLVDFVDDDSKRQKFIALLPHLKDLDFSKFSRLVRNEKDAILKMIADKKLNQCYIISENKQIDRQIMDAESALIETIGFGMGTILVFGDAEIVYYEGEEMGDRWISISL
jgi:hypothetical protein